MKESRWSNLTDLTGQRKWKPQGLHGGKALRSKLIQARGPRKTRSCREKVPRRSGHERGWKQNWLCTRSIGCVAPLHHQGRQLAVDRLRQKDPDLAHWAQREQSCHIHTNGILVPDVDNEEAERHIANLCTSCSILL